MNPVIIAQLREFARSNSIETLSEDKQFEIYAIFAVLSGHLGECLEAYDVHLQGNEFGVDGIAIIIQGEIVRNKREAEEKLELIRNPLIELIFFQAKTSTSFDYGDMSKFHDSVIAFFDGDLASESSAIADLVAAMRVVYVKGLGRRNPRPSCYYVTTGNYESPLRLERLRASFREQLCEKNIFDASAIRIEVAGARELQQWYRAAISSAEVEIDFARSVVMPTNSHVDQSYIGYVDAHNLLRLCSSTDATGKVTGINKAVFYGNIRDYDARSKINTAIKEGVRADGGSEFVFRNNGITVISKIIDRTGDKFRLEDFQIVNGCQTSNTIHDLVYGDTSENGDARLELA